MVDAQKSSKNKRVFNRQESRITQSVDIQKRRSVAISWFKAACEEHVIKLSKGLPAQWFEEAQLLRYGTGGKYGIHSRRG